MDEFLTRQLSLINIAIVDYREGTLGLSQLVNQIEALGNAIGGEVWDQQLFEIVLDLERVNSELIDKSRRITTGEEEFVSNVLSRLETVSNNSR